MRGEGRSVNYSTTLDLDLRYLSKLLDLAGD